MVVTVKMFPAQLIRMDIADWMDSPAVCNAIFTSLADWSISLKCHSRMWHIMVKFH